MTVRRVSAYKWVPPFAQGLVRDLRVRWALEEAGFAYEVDAIAHPDRLAPDYVAKQPFAQVPVYEEDDLVLFESGAIVLHLARQSTMLMPSDPTEQAHVTMWIFAALNSIEPCISVLAELDLFHAEQNWAREQRPLAEETVKARLQQLADALADRDYLLKQFSAADLMLVSVLRILRHTNILAGFSTLTAYQNRVESRPAFKRALEAQMNTFAAYEP
ncbi:MAG: glutathione S-transferase [Gammaproteobacteria bacterium HGW-Gammaproteobacteria-15]|nr:MAG: glutathione S-transferase [Gammaproteobacteria bacterium HGW-Gammaproteobacteria-15]